jgi:perosamine synthetase
VRSRLSLWPSLPPRIYARRRPSLLPFPLDAPNCLLFERGRHALWFGVRAAGLEPGDEILVPAYHCGAEIQALMDANLRCRFYEASETLEPETAELEALLSRRTRALFLIHYLGFPQDACRWRSWCDEHGLLLFEDCAQAWLTSVDGRAVGSIGDLAIYSFAKTFALPDGAALVSARRPVPPDTSRRLGLVPLAKRHAEWLMSRSRPADRLLSRFERQSDLDFALDGPPRGPSSITLFLLRRIPDREVVSRRRANYRRLLDEFSNLVPPPFAKLTDGTCPLVFPVATNRSQAEALVDRLARNGISAGRLWPVLHPQLPAREFPRAVAWHERFVALPVHQELRSDDVERIAVALADRSSAV